MVPYQLLFAVASCAFNIEEYDDDDREEHPRYFGYHYDSYGPTRTAWREVLRHYCELVRDDEGFAEHRDHVESLELTISRTIGEDSEDGQQAREAFLQKREQINGILQYSAEGYQMIQAFLQTYCTAAAFTCKPRPNTAHAMASERHPRCSRRAA